MITFTVAKKKPFKNSTATSYKKLNKIAMNRYFLNMIKLPDKLHI